MRSKLDFDLITSHCGIRYIIIGEILLNCSS